MNGIADTKKEATDVKSLIKDGFKTLNELVRMSNSFPLQNIRESAFNKNPSLMSAIELRSSNLTDIISNMLKKSDMGDIKQLNINDQLDVLVEANDKLLDKSKVKVDEMNGISCVPQNIIAPILNKSKDDQNIVQDFELMLQSRDPKPQDSFKVPVDNSNTPFVPSIMEKPNAIEPLSFPMKYYKNRTPGYDNPYEYEINNLEITDEQLRIREPINPKNLSSTPLIMVNDVQVLHEMISDLSTVTEIAVDLEHHSYRSFLGFTCLMQISTREKDYIVDTISLRDELIALQAIFTNQSIVKVMHGAESDIMWLQKDFSLYVVNLFDTHQAALLLGETNLNLGSLLQEHCGIRSNKSYQLHDWRRRPLSDGAIEYARSDTHYLLYIYDIFRNAILQKAGSGSLINVYNKSGTICVKQYEKELIYPDSYLNLYKKYRKNLNSRQLSAVQKLYDWRDAIAREEDESTGYVLSNNCLMKLAERLPTEIPEILKCFNNIPPLIRKHVSTIQQLLQDASNEPLVEKVVECRSRKERPKRNDVEILLSELSRPLDSVIIDNDNENNAIDILNYDDNVKYQKHSTLFDRFVTSTQVPSKLKETNMMRDEIAKSITMPYEMYKRTLQHNVNMRKKRGVLKKRNTSKKDVLELEKVETELVMEINREPIPNRQPLPLILPVIVPEAEITKNIQQTVKEQMRGQKKWKANGEVKKEEKEDRIIEEVPMITGDVNEGIDNKKEEELKKKTEARKKKQNKTDERNKNKIRKPIATFDYNKVNFSKFMTGPDNTLMKKLQKANAGLFGKKGKTKRKKRN